MLRNSVKKVLAIFPLLLILFATESAGKEYWGKIHIGFKPFAASPGKYSWLLSIGPSAEHIEADHQFIKEAIINALNKSTTSPPDSRRRRFRSIQKALKKNQTLLDHDLRIDWSQSPSLGSRPTSPGDRVETDVYPFTYRYEPAGTQSFSIRFKEAGVEADRAVEIETSLGQVRTDLLHVELTDSEKRIKTSLILKSSNEKASTIALAICANAYGLAKAYGIGANVSIPSKQIKTASDEIAALFTLTPDSKPKIRIPVNDRNVATGFYLEKFEIVRKVDVVIESLLELEQKIDSSDDRRKFKKMRQDQEAYLREKYIKGLAKTDYYYLTREAIDALHQTIEQEKGTTASDLEFRDDTLVMKVRQPNRILGFSIKPGVSYSDEKGIQGKLSLTTRNILETDDTLTVKGAGGGEAWDVSADWGIPLKLADKRLTGRIDMAFMYDHRREALLGDIVPNRIDEQRFSSDLKTSVSYDSFTKKDRLLSAILDPNRNRNRWLLTGDLGFELGNIHYGDTEGAENEPEEGTVPSLVIGFRSRHTHDFRGANKPPENGKTGSLPYFFESGSSLEFQQGFGSGDEFSNFHKLLAGLTNELSLGPIKTKAMFVRNIFKIGGSAKETPVAEQFRLGGSGSVRGLENGEFLGLSMLFTSVEAGAGLGIIRRLFSDRADHEGESKNKPGFDFSKLFVKVFYDFGLTSSDADFFNFSDTDTAHGFGVAFELGQIPVDVSGGRTGNLEAGYAYSPDSTRHEQGRLFMDFQLYF